MKTRQQDLWPQVTSFANLHLAFKKAARGKRRKPGVADFELDVESNLFALQDELRSGGYPPGCCTTRTRAASTPPPPIWPA
jgi:hypothetical protein